MITFASVPNEAIARELDISQLTPAMFLKGKVIMKLQFWQPASPVTAAKLVQGSDHIGMAFLYVHTELSPSSVWIVKRVEEGEVVRIETKQKPGTVDIHVRVGHEIRIHLNQNNVFTWAPRSRQTFAFKLVLVFKF